jgi:hypothetical protein
METVCFFKTFVSTDESTRRHDPKEQHRHLHGRENLKYQGVIIIIIIIIIIILPNLKESNENLQRYVTPDCLAT